MDFLQHFSRKSVQSSCFELLPGGCFLVCREDFEVSAVTDFLSTGVPRGLRGDSRTGRASPWNAREFTDLSDADEAQRGAVYLCRFAGAEYRRSVGLLTNVQALSSDMYLGWPSLNTLDSMLTIRGTSSGFLSMFHNTSVFARPGRRSGFKSFKVQSLGPQFWARILSKMQDSQLHVSLRHEVSSVPNSSGVMMSSGRKVPYGFALSAAPESVSALYEAWKCNTLTWSILRDYSSARLDSFLYSFSPFFVSWLQVPGIAALPLY